MAASFPNLYDYSSETGMTIPTVDEIKTYVQNAMYDIFGADIDLTDETPNGRLVEALTLMFRNVVGVNAQNMNQINISYASGQYLDAIAAFFDVFRLPATKSKIVALVYSDEPETVVPTGTQVTDVLGNAYVVLNNNDGTDPSITYDGIKTGNNPLTQGEYSGKYYAQGWVESVETGPIAPLYVYDASGATENGHILYNNVSGVIIIGNSVPGSILGRDTETDLELRSRIKEIRDYGGSSTLAIANAIWRAVPALRTVRVVENNTASQKVVAGVNVLPRSVLVAVGVDIPESQAGTDTREAIADAVFKSKAAGVPYSDYSSNSDINSSNYTIITNRSAQWNDVRKNIISVTDESSGNIHNVVFYEVRGIRIGIDITLKINGYSGTDIVSDVRNLVMQYVGGKTSTLTVNELMMVISSSITGVFVTDLQIQQVNGGGTWSAVSSVTPSALSCITPTRVDISVE